MVLINEHSAQGTIFRALEVIQWNVFSLRLDYTSMILVDTFPNRVELLSLVFFSYVLNMLTHPLSPFDPHLLYVAVLGSKYVDLLSFPHLGRLSCGILARLYAYMTENNLSHKVRDRLLYICLTSHYVCYNATY